MRCEERVVTSKERQKEMQGRVRIQRGQEVERDGHLPSRGGATDVSAVGAKSMCYLWKKGPLSLRMRK